MGILVLVLLIGGQFTVLSLFHQVSAFGPAYGSTDVCVAKWNYVQATVRVAITSDSAGPVSATLPNGTSVEVGAGSTYYVTLGLPRTGDFMGSEGISVSTTDLTQSTPIIATVDANVTSVPYSDVCSQLDGYQNVDVATIKLSGFASVAVSGYGVAL